MTSEELQKNISLTVKNFNIPEFSDALSHYEDLHKVLSLHIRELLDTGMERLMQILYRIDVSEEAVKRAFAEGQSINGIADRLARLCIERQLQKIRTREEYKNGKNL